MLPLAIEEDAPFLNVRRSVSGRVWRARMGTGQGPLATAIAQRCGVPDIVGRVLAGRGVRLDSAADFLEPSLRRDMPDPSSLQDMDAAASRLADAVAGAERVAVFGDYDVDGATSSALLRRVLSSLGCPVRVRIPDRITEGYGPNVAAMRELASEASLIVTVDCGTTGFESLDAAREAGADVVVLDHHQVGPELPRAMALVNPNRQDDLSGQGHLAAVGVAFLACAALMRELRRRRWPVPAGFDLLSHLDLVALGTVCDMVPLTGINRAFVAKGLVVMRHGRNPGVAALSRASRIKEVLASYHLGFLLGPRINAGGRIGDAALGATLLASDDPQECESIAQQLDLLNGERQAMEREAVADALAEAEDELCGGHAPVALVVAREGWHPGLVGLVASRITERHRRPAFAIALDGEGGGTGSGRSIAGVDLGRVVRQAVAEGVLVKGGGHAMAAGVTLPPGGLGAFRAFMEDGLRNAVEDASHADALLVDGALTAQGAGLELLNALEQAGPFGSGNPQPVFALPAHRVRFAEPTAQGHVRASLSSDTGEALKAIAFRAAEMPLGSILLSRKGQALHVAGTLNVDWWGGNPKPQLRIIDAAVPTRG